MLFDAPARRIARVCVDSPLPHLDRLFDYHVPDELAADIQRGCRVKVHFAGRAMSGFVVELGSSSQFQGQLRPIDKVVSGEAVLSPEIAELARAVADRYAGNLADVLRLAIPPRQAKVEKAEPPAPCGPIVAPPTAAWRRYRHGEAFVAALGEGKA
ncbi:MAG TPA: primosome assembly protein PriA, partial [Stackebrandtia sp.]|nr:primosome assembly protein PriA [Stackebrandtia sp.]